MEYNKKDEFNYNPDLNEETLAPETTYAPEYSGAKEISEAPAEPQSKAPEFLQNAVLKPVSADENKDKKTVYRRKKKIFVVAAALLTAVIILSSFNADIFRGVSEKTEIISDTSANSSPVTPSETEEDDDFPELDNLFPDKEGVNGWAANLDEDSKKYILSNCEDFVFGSEEFLQINNKFIHAGSLFTENKGKTTSSGTNALYEYFRIIFDNSNDFTVKGIKGASYDSAANILTLENFSGEAIIANEMGNGFTINLIGNNTINGSINIFGAIWGGSIKFTGNGTLTVNNGLTLICAETNGNTGEYLYTKSCMMVDKNVTLDFYGDISLLIEGTQMEKAFYTRSSIKMTGGEYANASYIAPDGTVLYNHTIIDNTGNISPHVRFAPDDNNPSDITEKPDDELYKTELEIKRDDTAMLYFMSVEDAYNDITAGAPFASPAWNTYYVWEPGIPEGTNENAISGIGYDPDENMITLNNCDQPYAVLLCERFGNTLKINLVGENSIAQLDTKDCGVTFTGSGSLKINEKKIFAVGILIRGEASENKEFYFKIENTVKKLEAFGTADNGIIIVPEICDYVKSNGKYKIYDEYRSDGDYPDSDTPHPHGAVCVINTTVADKKAISYTSPLKLSGTRIGIVFPENQSGYYSYTVSDDGKTPSMHVVFETTN